MSKLSSVKRVSRYANEDESFWQKHIKAFESSGLSIAGYCRSKGVNLDRFSYWKKKLPARKEDSVGEKRTSKSGLPLLAVKIRENGHENRLGALGLCSLDLGNGRVLQVHDVRALELILSRLN
jgi:hypothetical protein